MPLLLLAAVLSADPKPAPTSWVGNEVVASPDGKVLYARGKDGGVEAIDAATGKALWAVKDAARPFGASDKLVLAWVADKAPNAFRVVGFDAGTGKAAFKSDPVAMPEWATTNKQFGRSFRAAARADGDKVVLVWQANAFYAGGAAPPPEVEAAARKEAVGVAAIDPKTGKASAEDRKPKPEEFGAFGNKAGGFEFGVEEMIPEFKPGAAMVTKVTLTAMKGGKAVWTRELAGNPWSPPPP